jgi:hypothetical protein
VFQTLYSAAVACRHANGPFAGERERYLRHCFDLGATPSSLRQKGDELLWFAHYLGSQAPDGVNLEKLQEIAHERQSICKGRTSGQRLINIARPWLRFLGWWHVPAIEIRFQKQLDQYVAWMRDERGLSPATVERWQAHVGLFLQWCDQTDRQLKTLKPHDIDNYFVCAGLGVGLACQCLTSRRRCEYSSVSLRHEVGVTRVSSRQFGDLGFIITNRCHTPLRGPMSGGSWRTP